MYSQKNFLEQCLCGEALLQDIDAFVERWHSSDDSRSLQEVLGLTTEEYNAWLIDAEALQRILLKRKTETFCSKTA